MSRTDPALDALVGERREEAISGILTAMAQALDAGAEVVPEPEMRDAGGKVTRTGPLSLPMRGDLAVTCDGRTRIQRIETGPVEAGASIAVATDGGFVAEIGPFRWEAAEFTVYSAQEQPNWAPLRRWFLEWFQSRHSEVAPELFGAVHSLEGPRQGPRGWVFTVDFGSAPAACVTDLIVSLAETGAARVQIGEQ